MKRTRKSSKSSDNRRQSPPPVRKGSPQPNRQDLNPDSKRSVLRDILVGAMICVLFFVLVELLLRILGIPSRHPAEDPFVGFSGVHPLYTVKDGTASTAPDRLRYFNQVSFAVNKPVGALRIFCLGGSTTYGRPFDGRSSFGKWLEDLLKASIPQRTVQVINAGGISYASYRIVPLIREILQYHPDAVVLYTGHNEFLERRTYAGLFDQGKHLINVRALLEKLNAYRALKTLLTPLVPKQQKGDQGSPPSGKGDRKKSVLKDEVTAILDRSAGLDLYHRDDAFSQGVVRHFAYNLRTMITLCRDAKVPLILVQPTSNLKDFSPFKSEHDVRLTAEQKKSADEKLRRAVDLLKGNQAAEALSMLEGVIAADPLYAESYYWKGKALIALGRATEARPAFVRAKDLDVCPLRAISPLEQAVDRIAKEERVPVVPFRDILNRKIAETGEKSGVPGKESFLDHVHPTIEVHQTIAELILETLAAENLVHLSRTLGPDEKAAIYAKGMKGLDPEFFAVKDLNLAKVLNWAGKKEEARVFLERSADKLKDNPEVHKMLGGFLLAEKRYDEAVKEYSEAVRTSGGDPEMLYSLALAYSRAGLKEKAKEAYAEVMEKAPKILEASVNLALMHLEEGQTAKALEILGKGVERHPDSPVLFGPYALALAITGKPTEALPWMLKAVEAEPGDPSNRYNLAGIYALLGRSDQAVKTLNQAVDCGYLNADKLQEDQVFAPIRDLPEFGAVLKRIR